jgi:hypothetical protein
MDNTKHFFKAKRIQLVLGAALLATLTGCAGYMDAPQSAGVYMPAPMDIPPPMVEPTIVVQDDYVYYPSYGVYYSSSQRQYAYQDRGEWVSRPSPRDVSVDVLHASPSVRMNFHDSPATHHTEIVRQYPKNWAPARGNENEKHD